MLFRIPSYFAYTSYKLEGLQNRFQYFFVLMVGTSGLEPPTSRLSGVRSNHLSYAPI